MANNTKLSSWTTLRDYLARNIDPNKDWDNEDLRGYDVLNQAYTSGKLSADQFAEGKTALGQYLADVDADRNYRAATAKAENDARVETAKQDYLHTRLAGYLPQLQAGAGQTGYQGLTGGQAVALRNDMAQKQADIGARKQTALGGYLQTYQGALRDNSASATDQYTTIAATMEQERQQKESTTNSRVKDLLYGQKDDFGAVVSKGAVDDDGMIEQSKYDEVMAYLRNNGADEGTIRYWEMILAPIVNKTQTATSADARVEISDDTAKNGIDVSKMTREEFLRHRNYVEKYGTYEKYLANNGQSQTVKEVRRGSYTAHLPAGVELSDNVMTQYREPTKKELELPIGTVNYFNGEKYVLLESHYANQRQITKTLWFPCK